MKKIKTLKDTNPLAYSEWMDINDKNADCVSHGSNYKAWFKCNKCGHEWKSSVSNRTKNKNCPACANRVINNSNRLSTNYPNLVKDWDPSNEKSPDEFVYGSNFIVKWICHKCGFKWNTSIIHRSLDGHGCKSCAGQVVNDNNRLSKLCKRSINDWDYSKNILLPDDFTYKSPKKVYWKCKECGHCWQAPVSSYTKSRGCPKCSGFIANEHNCLYANKYLMSFYNDEKNAKEIHYKSGKQVKWKCNK